MRLDPNSAPVARRIHKRGQKKKVHLLGGPKSDGLLQLESRLEASVVIALVLDPRVQWIRPQPQIMIPQDGERFHGTEAQFMTRGPSAAARPQTYTPDFLVTLTDGQEVFLEAKHTRLIAKKPDILARPRDFAARGLRLVIVTERHLPETLDQNLRLLAPYTRPPLPGPIRDRISDIMQAGPRDGRTLTALLDGGQTTLLKAVAQGVLTCDLRRTRLGPSTRFEAVAAGAAPTHLEVLAL